MKRFNNILHSPLCISHSNHQPHKQQQHAPKVTLCCRPESGGPIPPVAQQDQQQWRNPQPHQDYYNSQQQQPYQDRVYPSPTANPQLHHVSDRRTPPPTDYYAPQRQQQQQQPTYTQITAQQPSNQHEGQYPDSRFAPPANHIPPPPHSSGPTVAGPRVRIDPSQVPHPIETQELDQNLYDDEDYLTCQSHGLVPLVGTDYRGVDQGNSLPRHLRATLPCMPSNHQLLDTTSLPFAVLAQPFAPLRYDEEPIPLVSSWVSGQSPFDPPIATGEGEEDGPPRCEKCRGYVNPWVRFVDGGRKWCCNLCGANNDVSPMYFSHLAPTGQRLDHTSRPELQHGTVDFPVGPSYWALQPPPSSSLLDAAVPDAISTTASDLLGGLQASLGQHPHGHGHGGTTGKELREKEKEREKERRRFRKPEPLGRVFVLDVSTPSAERGVVREVCEGIRTALYGKRRAEGEEMPEEEEVMGKGQRVAFVTVAESVSFWNLSPEAQAPTQAVVSDLDDMFIPFNTGFLVDPTESRAQIEAVLELIPTIAERGGEGMRVAAGSAVQGVLAGLRNIGGQINMFLSSLPTVGLGALTPREDPTIYNTDKERALFAPANAFWRDTAEHLAEAGIGANIFFFPEAYIDVASIGTLASATGGEIFFHPRFHVVRDRETVHTEIGRVLTRETAYSCTVRVRCSNGLRVSDHLGNFYQRAVTDLEFGTLDAAKSFVAVLKHEGRLDDRQPAFVQVAVLYTSAEGERRVRCLNMSFVVTGLIGNIYKYADEEATCAVLLKAALSQVAQRNLRDIRKSLNERCNRVLLSYRRHCAPAVQQGQLILPDGFKLLPLYTLCMIKSKPLKGGNVASDVRMHYTRLIKSLTPTRTLMLLYPRLLAIHDLSPTVGFPDERGRLQLPRFMRASYGWMVAEGAYLLVNGEAAMIWLGSAVSPQVVDDLYGVESLEELDVRMTRLPKLPTLLSTQIRNILTHLERIADHDLPVMIVRQNMDGIEIEFANQLVEDSNNDALSYTDYLMTAHREITNELSGGGKGEGWRPW